MNAMTGAASMMPAAALAAIRAAVEDAQRLGLDNAQGVTEHVVGELVAHGWTIVNADQDARPAAA
ncbi:hypothetical protein ACWGQL_01470 [Streptomyces lydicus]